jgi:Flp pilus assembly protein TadG
MIRLLMTRSRRRDQRGQILVLFVVSLVAMFAMLGLLLDGGHALALRRQLQDAGDAAALVAVNGITSSGATPGCSATPGPPVGAPYATIISAARAAVHVSLPNVPDANIVVTCVEGQGNSAVQVNVNSQSPGFFGGVVGMHGFAVGTTSQAINGKGISANWSVVELDPYHSSGWGGFDGCPSVQFSGSNTVIFDGSVQVNSGCPGGALSSNGNSATIQVNNGGSINLVGGYSPGPLTIVPTPLTGANPVIDPMLKVLPQGVIPGIPAIPWSTWVPTTVQAKSKTSQNGGVVVYDPGVYKGGLELKSSAIALLHPGIYVFVDTANGDGGLTVGSQASLYSVPLSATTAWNPATWSTSCTTTNCGVLIYNTGMTGNGQTPGSVKDNITVGGGANLMLRPYLDTVDPTPGKDDSYNHFLIWQDASPVPSSSYAQPAIALKGGGQMNLSGTVYAPSAAVQMGGVSGGAGGDTVDVTLQFISWDLQFNGNIGFHFFYSSDSFPKLKDYGLIK